MTLNKQRKTFLLLQYIGILQINRVNALKIGFPYLLLALS